MALVFQYSLVNLWVSYNLLNLVAVIAGQFQYSLVNLWVSYRLCFSILAGHF